MAGVVILDDLDRLTAGEARDVFRLVQLTASFPNIVYVLAFDRHQIEGASSTGRCDRGQCRRCGLSTSRGACGAWR